MQDTVILLGLQTSWGKFLQRLRCGCQPACAQKSSFPRATESMGTTGWASVPPRPAQGLLWERELLFPLPPQCVRRNPGGTWC